MKRVILFLAIVFTVLNIQAGDEISTWDTITFEKPYEFLTIDTSNTNIWIIGSPQKTYFNNSFEGQNAILTGLNGFYPSNNKSYFDIKIGAFNYPSFYPNNMFFEIKHEFDTDTLKDGGYITVSYDNGKTWTNIINDSLYKLGVTPNGGTIDDNLYNDLDTLFNGEHGFSGKSKGWITTKFSWHVVMVKKSTRITDLDTMIIRFNFISDNLQTNKEGWMIDNIRLYSVDLGSEVKQLQSNKLLVFPNPAKLSTAITFDKVYSEINLEIFNVEGQRISVVNEKDKQTIDISLKSLNKGMYFLKAYSDNKMIGSAKLIVK